MSWFSLPSKKMDYSAAKRERMGVTGKGGELSSILLSGKVCEMHRKEAET